MELLLTTFSLSVFQKQSDTVSVLDVRMGHALFSMLGLFLQSFSDQLLRMDTLLFGLTLFLLNRVFIGHAQEAKLSHEPSSSHLFAGESVTFMCDMREGNDTDWLYAFTWNGQQIVSYSANNSWFLHLTSDLSGDYQCVGRHKGSDFTKRSNVVSLSVSAHTPTATLTAHETIIPDGGTVTLTCAVTDPADWKYDWFRRTSDSHQAPVVENGLQNFISISEEGSYQCRGRRGNPAFFMEHSEVYHIQKTLSSRAVVTLQHHWTQVFSGETITIRCEIQGGGDTDWEYEWITTSPNTPPTLHEYSISRASVLHSGIYRCKGRRDFYSSTDWSNEFSLTVSSRKLKPTITVESRIIPVQGNNTLTCSVVNSAEWKYYWFRQTSSFSTPDIFSDGNSGQVLTISQGGVYHCKGGRGNFFTEESDAVTIEKRVSNKAVLLLQHNWSLIFSGETITFGCEINGDGNTEWEYEWSKPNSDVVLTHNECRIMNASVSSSGKYRCMGKHQHDLYSSTKWSDAVTLTVSAHRPKANISADNTAFPAGGSVALSCSVKPSSPGWRYYWYREKKSSDPLTGQDFVFHSDELISVSQEGLYWCRGGRGDPVYYTEYSDSVRINKVVTNRPVVMLQHDWPEIYSGESITLRCEIQGGVTEWDYEWETTALLRPPNQNTKDYRITVLRPSYHNGYYWCKGKMKSAQQNSTSWSASFKLTVKLYDKPKAVLSVSPSWLSPGASVTLSCEVEHSSAGWRFYWYKAVPQHTHWNFLYGFYTRYWDYAQSHTSYRYEVLPGSINGTEQNQYIIHGLTQTSAYACSAERGNPVYYTYPSEAAFVWSKGFHPPASIAVRPSRVQHFTSDSVSLSCEGNSTWWRIMRFIEGGSLSFCSTESMCYMDVNWPKNAVYWCESGSGEFSSAVNITLSDDIILTSPVHPVNEVDSVTLGCKLRTGNFVPTVAFYKNGKLIQKDERQELNISEVSKSDEGFYKCQYSGYESSGSWILVKSSSASLSVALLVGLVSGILLIFLLPLLIFCCCRKSKDPCCNSQSPRTSPSSAASQTINQDENQQQIYSSLLHGDACVYESIRLTENTGNGGQADDYTDVISQIQIRRQKRKCDDPVESCDYHNENPDPQVY